MCFLSEVCILLLTAFLAVSISYFVVRVLMGNSSARSANQMSNNVRAVVKMHHKCRGATYPRTELMRFAVPDDKVLWNVEFPEYVPVDFTADSVNSQPVWADLDFRTNKSVTPKWNKVDGKVNRKSHMGTYEVVDQLPRNPVGRTGIIARGCLGRWGPNHAADPIVTRWKRGSDGSLEMNSISQKAILQFIAIQRRDTGEWAIPGGMVDPGEIVSVTIKREFGEEAMNTLEKTPAERQKILTMVDKLFRKGDEVYRGYVDDPRNTDNAWMETVAINFHDEKGDSVANFQLHAGDDAMGVQWTDVDQNLKLYASHIHFIEQVVQRRNAHW